MRLRSDLVLRNIGNDYVIVEPSKDMVDLSKVFNLNDTAAWLWKELQSKDFTLETIVELMESRFETDEKIKKQIRLDAEKLILDFRKNGLLTEG